MFSEEFIKSVELNSESIGQVKNDIFGVFDIYEDMSEKRELARLTTLNVCACLKAGLLGKDLSAFAARTIYLAKLLQNYLLNTKEYEVQYVLSALDELISRDFSEDPTDKTRDTLK